MHSNLNKDDANRVVVEQEMRLKDQELTIEGLSQANTDLEREIAQHRVRYDGALRLIESKTRQINDLNQKTKALSKTLSEVAEAFLKLRKATERLANEIGKLKDVPVSDLDASIDSLQAEAYKAIQ
jgi:chromosome segregation ATPase